VVDSLDTLETPYSAKGIARKIYRQQVYIYSFRDLSVHPDGQTDMVRSTRVVTPIKKIYIL